MSLKLCCSLCLTPTNEYDPLQNDDGDFNDTYEITIKYFDPTLLKTDEKAAKYPQKKQVLCQSCWLPIKYFNKFQQNIVKARSLSEKIIVEVEDADQVDKINNHINADDYCKNGHDGGNYTYSYENNAYVKPDLNLEPDYEEQEFISDEDNEKDGDEDNEEDDKDNEEDDKDNEEDDKDDEDDKPLISSKLNNINKSRESNAIIAEWKPILECDLCEETFSSVEKLRLHFKQKHKASFYIKCCERKFHRRCTLVDHIKKHLNRGSDKFECEFCHKIFNLKKHLIQHMKTHATEEKNFVCKECGKAFALEVYLKAHIKRLHNVEDSCAPTSKKHSMKNGFIEKITFTCDVCGMELDSPVSLNNHMAVFHIDSSTVYVCSICGTIKPSAKDVLDHKKFVHDGVHKCLYCDKPYTNSKNLSEHVAIHTGHDLYQCPHCPKTFRARSSKSNHCKKVHPIEWEKARKDRLKKPKADINLAQKQIVI